MLFRSVSPAFRVDRGIGASGGRPSPRVLRCGLGLGSIKGSGEPLGIEEMKNCGNRAENHVDAQTQIVPARRSIAEVVGSERGVGQAKQLMNTEHKQEWDQEDRSGPG